MTPERWQQIKHVFQSAIERPTPERAAYLDQACVSDPSLRSEVEAFISSYEQAGGEQAGGSLETMVMDVAAQMIAGQETAPTLAQKVGPYELVKKIGAGGMGEVYLARDNRLARQVALKLLPPHVGQDKQRLERFKQEARTASALNHPNILTIYEIGEEAGRPFIATELIEGETLRERIAAARLPLNDALDVAVQVATGLNAAHEAGIVHRDIKPENLMLRRDGYVKILDFGLAKLINPQADGVEISTQVKTNEGVVMGTPRYMSPEQARGQKVDARTDIWGLGVVLYEMVTGHRPFAGETVSDVLVAILEKEPLPLAHSWPEVPAELEHIVERALRKEREERYQTSKDLLLDLKRLKQRLEFEAESDRAATMLREAETITQARQVAAPHRAVARKVWLGRRGLIVGLLALLLAMAGTVYLFYFAGPTQAINSIAVLPLVNASNDANVEYLSDGLAEALINSLTELQQLRVIARSTAFRYKGKEVDPQAVGRELKVRSVLMGTVRQLGERLTIQVDLVDATTGAQLWGREYERQVSEVLSVKQAIAQEITEKLRLRLSGEEQKRLVRRDTTNTEAYQHYLKGRYYWNRRTGERLQRAIEEFRQALDKDPVFGGAWAGLADCYGVYGFYGLLSPRESLSRGKEAAEKALQLDETLAEAHASLGWILLQQWQWGSADREFRRAIEMDPNYATARIWYGIHLHTAGQFDEALSQMQQARNMEPVSLIINTLLGWHYLFRGRFDPAIDQLLKTVQLDPTFPRAHWDLGIAYEQKGQYARAIAEFERGLQLSGDAGVWLGSLGHALALSGKREEARDVLSQLTDLARRQYISPFEIALVHAGLAEREPMYDWLERAYEDRSTWLTWLKHDPRFVSYRQDERFVALLRRIGLERPGTGANTALDR